MTLREELQRLESANEELENKLQQARGGRENSVRDSNTTSTTADLSSTNGYHRWFGPDIKTFFIFTILKYI